MRLARVLGLVAFVLLFSSVANAEIVTISDTLDYTDNGLGTAPWFIIPNEILDHSPYYRGVWEDWGWTHDVGASVPKEAIGIQAATVSILAWDVDSPEGEIDMIYANDTQLGALFAPDTRVWTTTSFDLPADVRDALWRDARVNVFMDIDMANSGHRVTLRSATLAVDYIVSGVVPEPATVALLGLGALLLRKRRR